MGNNKPLPSYAPVYAAALYPKLATIARKHGYALAVHGSLQRDLDLIAIPWIEAPSAPEAVVAEFTSTFAIREVGGPPSDKPHGRRAWTLSIGFGECAIDLSFMPLMAAGAPLAQQPLSESANNAGVATGSRNDSTCERVTQGSLPPPSATADKSLPALLQLADAEAGFVETLDRSPDGSGSVEVAFDALPEIALGQRVALVPVE